MKDDNCYFIKYFICTKLVIELLINIDLHHKKKNIN